jgi:hypothetical protein
MRQESIGGRFETDGTFNGTRWDVEGPEPADDEAPDWRMTPRPPTAAEAAALTAIANELVRRHIASTGGA